MLADPLEGEEPGVALVEVEHLRVDTEGAQCPHAADAEDDLLAQAMVGVAAVEAVGDRHTVGGVAFDVGVEEVQRHPADVGAPHADRDGIAGEVDGHTDAGVGEPERLRVHVQAVFLLPTVGVELLVEVALGVQQADADERHTEVGGRLEVVAGQHAEASGVLRQGFGQPEFGGEVGNRSQRRRRLLVGLVGGEPGRPADRRIEAALGSGEVTDDGLVVGQHGEALRRRRADHVSWVGVIGGPPRPDPLEQAHRLAVPRPMEVGRQLR